MFKHSVLFFLFFLSVLSVFSQSMQVRKYATQKYMNVIRSTDTAFLQNSRSLESYTLNFRQYGSMDTAEVPVVFHVVYSGQTPPVTVMDIEAQLARLNIDFFTPAHPYAADDAYDFSANDASLLFLHPADRYEGYAMKAALPMIKFCFPETDPQGNPTSGILFVPTNTHNWGLGNALKNSASGGSSPWTPAHYCNVWITDLTGGIAGYAQMPGASLTTDGIVIDEKYFFRVNSPYSENSDFTLGRTLSHLMGSYLNLYELWNEDILCADDFVDDTPIHNAPNHGKSAYRHVTTCDGHAVEMTMNLMDSGPDSSMYMFTYGQVARMQATLSANGPRSALTQTATGCNQQPLEDVADRSDDPTAVQAVLQVRTVPNPNSGDFTLEIETEEAYDGEVLVQIFNSSGRLTLEKKITQIPASISRLPVSGYGWPSGIYTVKVSTGKEIQIKKVAINR